MEEIIWISEKPSSSVSQSVNDAKDFRSFGEREKKDEKKERERERERERKVGGNNSLTALDMFMQTTIDRKGRMDAELS